MSLTGNMKWGDGGGAAYYSTSQNGVSSTPYLPTKSSPEIIIIIIITWNRLVKTNGPSHERLVRAGAKW
jgi:hypothetical protein